MSRKRTHVIDAFTLNAFYGDTRRFAGSFTAHTLCKRFVLYTNGEADNSSAVLIQAHAFSTPTCKQCEQQLGEGHYPMIA